MGVYIRLGALIQAANAAKLAQALEPYYDAVDVWKRDDALDA